MKLLILGAGHHGNVIAQIAADTGLYEQIAFLDDIVSRPDILGHLADFPKYAPQFDQVFVAIGNAEARRCWQETLENAGYTIATLVHPKSWVASSAVLGAGSVVMPMAVVQNNVQCGKGCILSAGAILDHDCVIGSFSHINAGAIVPAMSNVPPCYKLDYGKIYETE